jgi:hypothetical protein
VLSFHIVVNLSISVCDTACDSASPALCDTSVEVSQSVIGLTPTMLALAIALGV